MGGSQQIPKQCLSSHRSIDEVLRLWRKLHADSCRRKPGLRHTLQRRIPLGILYMQHAPIGRFAGRGLAYLRSISGGAACCVCPQEFCTVWIPRPCCWPNIVGPCLHSATLEIADVSARLSGRSGRCSLPPPSFAVCTGSCRANLVVVWLLHLGF